MAIPVHCGLGRPQACMQISNIQPHGLRTWRSSNRPHVPSTALSRLLTVV